MKLLRLAIFITSLASIVLTSLAIVMAINPGVFGISTACPGCILPIWWFYALLIGAPGGLLAFVATVLAVVDAARRADRTSMWLLVAVLALVNGGGAYLIAAERATIGPGGASAGAPSAAVVLVWAAVALFIEPVATLLYGLLQAQQTLRLAALGGLALVSLVAPLVIAPPWVTFNTANGAPTLTATAPSTTVDCSLGKYPPIILKNTGSGMLRWTSFAAFNAVTINPSSGALGPGAAQTVTLAGAYTPSADRPQTVGAEFDSNGGSQRVEYGCRPEGGATPTPSGGISASPMQLTAQCSQGTYPPITITDTSQSDTPWSATTKAPSIVVSPASGTLHAGQSQTLTLSGTTSIPTFSVFVSGMGEPVIVACH